MPRPAAKGAKTGSSAGPTVRIAIAWSRYNESVTGKLLEGARRAFVDRTGDARSLVVLECAGSFETVAVSAAAARSGKFDGVVALGCIVKGETSHDQHLAAAVTTALAQISVATGVPAGLGVLTVDTVEQAHERAGGKHGNKGAEAMDALLDTLRVLDEAGLRKAAGVRRGSRAGATKTEGRLTLAPRARPPNDKGARGRAR